MNDPDGILAAAGLTINLDDDDLVAGALVLLKILEPDGTVRLQMAHAGLSWIERAGALAHAQQGELDDADHT